MKSSREKNVWHIKFIQVDRSCKFPAWVTTNYKKSIHSLHFFFHAQGNNIHVLLYNYSYSDNGFIAGTAMVSGHSVLSFCVSQDKHITVTSHERHTTSYQQLGLANDNEKQQHSLVLCKWNLHWKVFLTRAINAETIVMLWLHVGNSESWVYAVAPFTNMV